MPCMVANLLMAFFWLQLVYIRSGDSASATAKTLKSKYHELGPFSARERLVTLCFSLMVALWFLRAPRFMPGWGQALTWTDAKGDVLEIRNTI